MMAIFAAAVLAAASLTACTGGQAQAQTETEVQKVVNLEDIHTAIKEAYGENYVPNNAIDAEMLEALTGIKADQYTEFFAEMPMISTFVETIIGVKASEGNADKVEEELNAYRDMLVNDTMQYPMNVSKIQASQVVRHGDYVFFVMLGAPTDESMEEGDEAALESAKENNQKAIDVIDGFFK